ncbi:MAG: right-handed parallel beta-helix repeat-containing protein [Chloroflexi bacterium]|nr:right-handed parallel beta-helix repeat-containing protein [Chloroflexota bacterium]
MHTKFTKKISKTSFQVMYAFMILSMLLAAVGVQPASASTFHTISGNAGVASATVTYNGDGWFNADGSVTADGSGNYTITVLHGWDGTVTPSKAGYSFSPTSRSYADISVNQTGQNYTATAVTYTISGSTGTAGAGATLTYTGGSTTADGTTGNYSFTVPGGWSGTVTPSKAGFTFTPPSRSYTNITSNQTNQNYTAAAILPTISGNAGVGSAILSYTDGTPKTVTANSTGAYTLQVSNNWSGTVTPSKTGFAFSPANRVYTNVTSNQTAQDYTARPTAFSFASIADGHAEVAYFTATVNQVATLNPALVIFNGDLEDSGFTSTEINPMVNALKAANLFNKTYLVRGNADNHVAGSAALWETYFETAPNIKVPPAYVTNKVAINSSSDQLTYSFDYGNSIFIGIDVPGDIDFMTTEQMNFLDARLTYAEGQGLTHAFIFFHSPEYPVESVHSLCSTRTDANCTPPALMTIINNHPIVTATFHGHEHVLSWTHMDSTRVAGLTRSYEQFVTSPAGGTSYYPYLYPDRVDYAYSDMDNSQGFATISVNGLSFTYNMYKVGTSQPVWSRTFSKINTPPTISDITDKATDEDIATGDISFTVGDAETPAAFLAVAVTSSNTTLVPSENISQGGSGAARTINITPAANQYGTATITVSAIDGSTATASDTFLLTVNPVNDAPVAEAQSVSLSWNTSIDLILTGTDVENSPLTYSIVDDPSHGSLSGSGANRTYTPATNYSGTDSFTFKVNDGTSDSVPGTVSINVTAHTISGNAGVAGATLGYTDGTPKTVTANGAGVYNFQVPTDWSGTVTPSKAGYIFSPTSMSYTNVLADQTGQDYTTTGVTFTISGNAGVAGATLSYMDGTPKTVTADGTGLYSFEVPYNWSGMVTPSLSGYGFRPATRTYSNLTSNQFGQDYSTTTARVFYVDKTNPACTDVGTVGSFAVPFCTIGRGAYLATAGQIVHVIHGTYAETVYPRLNGVAGNPITYWGDPGVTVTGQPQLTVSPYTAYPGFALTTRSYIVIDGFYITQTGTKGIYADSSSYLTITNNHVTYAGAPSTTHPYEQGIYLKATTNSTISGNTTDHNTCIGIRLLSDSNYNLVSNNLSYSNFSIVESDAAGIETTGSSHNTIINNVTYSNEDSGINIYVNSSTDVQSTYNLVINNLSYENGDHGIDVNNSPFNTIVGNTVHGNGTAGINVEGEAATGSHHTTLINNITAGNGFTPPAGSFAGNLRVDSASVDGTTLDYNLYNRESAAYQLVWNDLFYTSLATFKAAVPTQEVHGLEGDPKFVDPVPSVLRQTGVHYVGLGIFGNYYPEPGSPAIDSANSNAPSQQATDIDGNARVDDPATPDTGAGVRAFDDRGAYEFLPLGQSLPIVTTQPVTEITTTTATGNGNITATGEPNPTQHGVVWNTTGTPTVSDSKTTDGAVSATGPFISLMTGLIPGTQYYVRAYATNTMGTVYGEEVSFTSLIVPTVTTQAVTNITTTTATGNGNITALGIPNPTQHGVVWSTSANPTTEDSKTTGGSVSATGAFTGNITGLTPGTLYHVRAYATNTAGTSYGEDVTFTAYHIPTVTTQAVTAITTTTATGNGNIADLGVPNPSQHGVVWSTFADPTVADNKTTDGEAGATGAFTSLMTGLTPGTLYHVRAYASNSAGTVYGEDVTFTTLLAPTVTTQAVTAITTTTATGNGNITVLGTYNPTEHGVVWAITANPTTADSKTTDGPVSATGSFTSSITGLIPGTLYHVRAYATSDADTSYGEDVTFTALLATTVTTQAVSSIGTTNATGNGNVTDLGVPNPTQHGVVWSTLPNPTTADNKTTDGDVAATGAFTSSITGLTPGMLYHVRAYATNAVTTSYGEDVTFTTLPSITGITTPSTNAGTGSNVTQAGTADWANPGFITADDTSYASATLSGSILSSGYLEGTNYGFTIPENAVIQGIMVTIGRHESGIRQDYIDVRDSTVKLMKAGTIIGNNKAAAGTEWPTATASPAIYGTTADLWGTTWTPAEINASNFGVALSVISGVNRIAYVDYMQISVTYTVTMVGSNLTVDCGAGTPIVTYGSDITCVASVVRGSGDKTPTGNVSWATNGSGTFVTSPCTLSGSDGTATCSVTYTPNSVGSGSHLITANYAGDPNFFASSGEQALTVNKAAATVTLGSLAQTYDGTPRPVTAVTNPAGLSVGFTYDGSATAPTNAGSYAAVATITDPNYIAATDNGTLVIAKAAATVTLGSLSQTYDGTPKSATAITDPAGLTVDLTYDGSATAPTNAGLYTVVGTINDINYAGSTSGTFYIAKAAATVTLGSLSQTYDGTPKSATAITDPAGLTVDLTYDGSTTAPTNAGSYAVVATINDINYAGSASDTLVIAKAAATVTLGNLIQAYDGTPKSATVTTVPDGLTVEVTYEGSPTPPTALGSYAVAAIVTNPNYSGSANGTLVIEQAIATHNIPLIAGWNLISFNVSPENTDVATVLATIDGNYDLIYAWDASSASDNWLMYDPSVPVFLNSLDHLDETIGFWIHMTAPDTLEVTGLVPVTTNINLHDNAGGWNLVAYPSGVNRPLPEVLSDRGVGTDFSLVYAYHAGDAVPWKLFDRELPIFLNDLTEMSPGWGYWVKVSAEHTWNVRYLAE